MPLLRGIGAAKLQRCKRKPSPRRPCSPLTCRRPAPPYRPVLQAVWDRYVTPASRRPAKKAKKAHSGKASMLCCGPASVSVKE